MSKTVESLLLQAPTQFTAATGRQTRSLRRFHKDDVVLCTFHCHPKSPPQNVTVRGKIWESFSDHRGELYTVDFAAGTFKNQAAIHSYDVKAEDIAIDVDSEVGAMFGEWYVNLKQFAGWNNWVYFPRVSRNF